MSQLINRYIHKNHLETNVNSNLLSEDNEEVEAQSQDNEEVEYSETESESEVESESESEVEVESEKEDNEEVEKESEKEAQSEDNVESESELETESETKDIGQDIHSDNLDDSDIAYVIKVNGTTKCYCNTTEEVDSMVNYIIHRLKSKYKMEQWNNVECISRDGKIVWKVLDTNKIVAQITGSKYNSLLFYEQILSEIEVEIVKKYNNNKQHLLKL